ncbi:MAG TPA: type I-E CRISPR-associated protein Cse2/CasB [Pseudonocardiaceae bacterium]|nr:type I-E CRISPR-associated protein Cse2/CasB [Pseudonocardiaceae bacterium]
MTEDVTATPTPPVGSRDDLWTPAGRLVDRRIRKWQRDLLGDRPSAQAASLAVLARLRRGAGKPADEVPDILALTVAAELAGPDAPDAPTRQETAAHHALTLYALHQQSRTKPMYRMGDSLGRALRRLLGQNEPSLPPDPITRRFQILITADSFNEFVHHARGAVQLLRGAQSNAIPLDYGRLADELVQWQTPGGAAHVRRKWARDFYRQYRPAPADTSPSDQTDDTDPEGN